MSIASEPFGVTNEGTPVERYTLRGPNGFEAQIMTYGGTITALRVPDRHGALGDVVLGFPTLAGYLAGHPYFGSLIGRFGNRIAKGQFRLGGRGYQLAQNNGPNHLHGGLRGFDKVVWQAELGGTPEQPSLSLHYRSPDGEEGYPGNLEVRVVYALGAEQSLRIDYEASSDQETVLNLTNHSYFNLAGAGDILGHELLLRASHVLPTDATQIPTGELRAVQGTPMDFLTPRAVGAQISADDEQLRYANGGYDHTWVLDRTGAGLELAAQLSEPISGRVLEVLTTQPGVQFYSGNFLDGSLRGKGNQAYGKHAALCLETQHFPDSPNQPTFPSTLLRPGERYQHTTCYRFSIRPAESPV